MPRAQMKSNHLLFNIVRIHVESTEKQPSQGRLYWVRTPSGIVDYAATGTAVYYYTTVITEKKGPKHCISYVVVAEALFFQEVADKFPHLWPGFQSSSAAATPQTRC